MKINETRSRSEAKARTETRLLLYAHCLIAFACLGLTIYALEQRNENDQWLRFWMHDFFSTTLGVCAWWLCFLSCFLVPIAFASGAGGTMAEPRRRLIVLVDTFLGIVQLLALLLLLAVTLPLD